MKEKQEPEGDRDETEKDLYNIQEFELCLETFKKITLAPMERMCQREKMLVLTEGKNAGLERLWAWTRGV